jgi:hypothetical protein
LVQAGIISDVAQELEKKKAVKQAAFHFPSASLSCSIGEHATKTGKTGRNVFHYLSKLQIAHVEKRSHFWLS